MKLLICGSRSINVSTRELRRILFMFGLEGEYSTIISGGADGPDTTAIELAYENDVDLEVYPADWKKYGKKAGIIRNKEMVYNCDACVALWDGKSRGTKFTIDEANRMKKKVFVVEHKDAL